MIRPLLAVIMLLQIILVQAQENKIDVGIFQNGKPIKNDNHVFHLKGDEFSFQITSKGYEGFLLGATLEEDLYRSALGDADLDVNWFAETGMAEAMFNEDKSMFVSDEAPSYWYYTDKKDHRFDHDPLLISGGWEGSRTIKTFYDIVQEKEISVVGFKKSLFVYFYAPIYNDDYELIDRKELFHAELRFDR